MAGNQNNPSPIPMVSKRATSNLEQIDKLVAENCAAGIPGDESSVKKSRYFFKVTKTENKSFKVTGRQNIAWI